MARPESKNVFYFPHYTKSTIELDLIEHKHKSEGYKAYYRLMELVADADYHRLSVASENDKVMFDLGMNCNEEVVNDVIKILIDKGRVDKQLWEEESIIWMQDFVETLRPVYVNRRKPLPTKNLVSTSNNIEKRKEKKKYTLTYYESIKNKFFNNQDAIENIIKKHRLSIGRLDIESTLMIKHYDKNDKPILDFEDELDTWLYRGQNFEDSRNRTAQQDQVLDSMM